MQQDGSSLIKISPLAVGRIQSEEKLHLEWLFSNLDGTFVITFSKFRESFVNRKFLLEII